MFAVIACIIWIEKLADHVINMTRITM